MTETGVFIIANHPGKPFSPRHPQDHSGHVCPLRTPVQCGFNEAALSLREGASMGGRGCVGGSLLVLSTGSPRGRKPSSKKNSVGHSKVWRGDEAPLPVGIWPQHPERTKKRCSLDGSGSIPCGGPFLPRRLGGHKKHRTKLRGLRGICCDATISLLRGKHSIRGCRVAPPSHHHPQQPSSGGGLSVQSNAVNVNGGSSGQQGVGDKDQGRGTRDTAQHPVCC